MTTANLYSKLKQAKSEEDVKDAYIKALGLKSFTKGMVDIRTKEIWFEAKDKRHTIFFMFTQLLNYVHDARTKGEEIPPFLAVIDNEKAAIMKTADVLPFLDKKTIKWGKSASKVTPEALAEVSAHIGAYFVKFNIATQEDEFISTVKEAIKTGGIIRTQITPDNLAQVFQKWCKLIGKEIAGIKEQEDYALLFFADIMHDGKAKTYKDLPARLIYDGDDPDFDLRGTVYTLGNHDGYHEFWTIYHKPPSAEYRDYLLARRDSLIPINDRMFKGAYYTPLNVVEKAYDKLSETLGKGWQKKYLVWDMCCGVGNLETQHGNHKNLYMSTLDKADIDIMHSTKTCPEAHRFQYDYLNDDIVDSSTVRGELVEPHPSTSSGRTVGQIDYNLTNKVPIELRNAIAEGKKILVLINPPYAESGTGVDSGNKEGVATMKMSEVMDDFGYAKRELFAQFLVRIYREIPTATVAIFSKLKYVTSPNFEQFREIWNAKYLGGFVVHSKAFDGLSGNFPIGFLVWKTKTTSKKKQPIIQITAEVLDKKAQLIGEKCFYNLPSENLLTKWVIRPKPNKTEALPLKNAISPATKTKDVRGSYWSDDAIGCLYAHASDMQNANLTALLSSGYSSPGAFFVNHENLWQVAIIFTVRLIIKKTWINDRDQFLQPTAPLSDEFKNDCLIWMLFNGSNLTASAKDLEWNGKTWAIVNHFIPFKQTEVGAAEPFESDFMTTYLKGKKQSPEAKAVLNAGKVLWSAYFSKKDKLKISVKEDYKLNRLDVGWYQIRNALKSLNDTPNAVSFDNFDKAYKKLTEKCQPQVYEFGFLRDSEKSTETNVEALES